MGMGDGGCVGGIIKANKWIIFHMNNIYMSSFANVNVMASMLISF